MVNIPESWIISQIYDDSVAIVFELFIISNFIFRLIKYLNERLLNESKYYRRLTYVIKKMYHSKMTNLKRKIKRWESEKEWQIAKSVRMKKPSKRIKLYSYRYIIRYKGIGNKRKRMKNKLQILGSYTSTIGEENMGKSIDQARKLSFNTDSYEIGVDNRSSYTMTNNPNDFVGPIKITRNNFVRGIGGLVKVDGIGTVEWNVVDDNGTNHKINIPGTMLVKSISTRLLSPQHWAQISNDNYPIPDGTRCITMGNKLMLEWNQRKYSKTIPISQSNNCFTFTSTSGISKYEKLISLISENISYNEKEVETCILCNNSTYMVNHQTKKSNEFHKSKLEKMILNENGKYDTTLILEDLNEDAYDKIENLQDFVQKVDQNSNINMNTQKIIDEVENSEENLTALDDQAELMRWHYRLGHISFKKLKILAVMGLIPKRLVNVKSPKCAGCIFGKMTRRPWRTKPTSNGNRKIFKTTKSGQCVSVDQMESTEQGFIAQLKGKLTKRRYKNATIFVDHYSDLSYVHLQSSLDSNETLQAKNAFEAYARKMGVQILHYHADNGRFADKLFINDVENNGQTISYCGVGAHFQNGRAEKRIRDLREKGRTILLHAISRWPHAITVNLWPYALRSANDQLNTIPFDINGTTRLEKFSNVNIQARMKDFHTWGCPVYALHNKLQSINGGSVSKWNSRSRLGINLGLSPRHSRTVNLVLSLDTGLVSPQYHIKHDDFFETTRQAEVNNYTSSKWQILAGFMQMKRSENDHSNENKEDNKNISTLNEDTNKNKPHIPVSDQFNQLQQENDEYGSYEDELGRRRSRRHQINENITESSYYECMHEDDYRLQDEMRDPIAFQASSDPDTMYWGQAMNEPDAEQFQNAAIKEFNDHSIRNHWELIERINVPTGKTVIPSVWSMKRKRDIKTRQITKYKARLNIHGGKQVFGEDYYETFAPVVTWMTIRLILVLSLICGWESKQIDFVLAFPQAEIEQDMFMELPPGIRAIDSKKDYVLKLKKNLYGQKQAGRIFYLHLKKGLERIGFKASKIDECLFYRGATIFIVYVDDGIFFDKNKDNINVAIRELKDNGYDIEDKGDIADYLGVNVTRLGNNLIELSQPHLIKQLLNDTNLTNKKFKPPPTPAKSSKILQRFENATDFDNRWHYRSVIGKLNFLEKTSRPDIAYAVHQCARFCENPKKEHAEAVEHLIKYLSGTANKGIYIQPSGDPVLYVYADADFSGNWNKSTAPEDSSTAKSRTGYFISFANCPIIWISKLQTQVALSTTEAEYIALSQSLRDAIPLMQIIQELRENKIVYIDDKARVHCRCFEDNTGALELANVPKLRPRTKHINLVYHHFRDHVRKGLVKIFPISTSEQIADILTKPLPQNDFQRLRRKMLMW